QHTQTVPPPRRQHRARHFDMPLPVFGKGRPRKPRPLVETTPRIGVGDLRGIARLPLRGVAREGTVRVLVNGKLEALDGVCEARNYGGGGQRYFLCPTCSRRVWHLYLRDERLVPAVRRPDLQEPAHAQAGIEPCARSAPQARCAA